MTIRAAMLVLVVLGSARCGPSQDFHWWISGVPCRQIGANLTVGIGDLNHDGYEDLVTIVQGWCCGPGGGGSVYLWFLSGRDGTRFREVVVPVGGAFVTVARAGDDNGDGVPDYAVSWGTWATEVRSGVDDSVIWRVPYGYSWHKIVGDLDVDGDGKNDLVVADWHMNNWNGEVRAYGHGGTLLWTIVGGAPGTVWQTFAVGNWLAKLGDVNDDGKDDFVMGCYEPTGRGAAVVVSGADGSFLHAGYGELPGDGIGWNVEACGDLDLDGYTDFAAGNGGTSFVPRGVVRVFSGRTGQPLMQFVDPMHNEFSQSVSSRGIDLDGDGMPDFVIGAPAYYNPVNPLGAVSVFSGRNGAQLHFVQTLTPGSMIGRLGSVTATLRPPVGEHSGFSVIGDRVAFPTQMLIYTPLFPNGIWCSHDQGAIRVYRGLPRTATLLGDSCPGTLLSAPDIGMRSLGSAGVRVHLARAPASAPAVLLLGLSTTQIFGIPLPLALDPLGFPGCHLLTSIDAQALVVAGASGTDAGYAFVDLPHPVPTIGQGSLALSAQWVVLGLGSRFPGGTTQAVQWRR